MPIFSVSVLCTHCTQWLAGESGQSPKTGFERKTSLKNRSIPYNDYYAEGEHIRGQWMGRGADLLDLSGEVTRCPTPTLIPSAFLDWL
jgi:hypothetical protein